MAKKLSLNNIQTGQAIEAAHVSQSVNALTGNEAYDITISGSLEIIGPLTASGDVKINPSQSPNGTSVLTVDNSGKVLKTGSYGGGGGTGTGFPFSGSAEITGSLLISQSGLIVTGSTQLHGSGSTIFQVQGSRGVLFSIDDDESDNKLFSVNNVTGVPVLEVYQDNTVKLGKNNGYGIIITGSGLSSPDLNANIIVTGSIYQTGSNVVFSSNLTSSGNIEINKGILSIKNNGNQSVARFYCEDNNQHYTELKAQPHALYSGNPITLLPAYDFDFAAPDFQSNITASGNISASGYISASNLNLSESITATNIYATNLIVTNITSSFITSSTIVTSGSNTFGDELSDVQTLIGSTIVTGSISVSGSVINNLTSSNAISSSYSLTASYVENAQSASYVLNAISASFANTASYVLNAISASFANTSLTANSSSQAISASHAITASHALNVATPTLQEVTTAGNQITNQILIKNNSLIISKDGGGNKAWLGTFNSNDDGFLALYTGNGINVGLKPGTSYINSNLHLGGNGDITNQLQVTGDALITSNLTSSANISASGYISASSFNATPGTINELTSSYAVTASHALNVATPTLQEVTDAGSNTTTAITGSNISASGFISASEFIGLVTTAQTASYVENAQTASYVETAQTASYVTTAQTASFVTTAQTASYVLNAVSSSYALSASYADTASFAQSGNGIFSGSFSGSFVGDGSELTNIPASGITGLNLSRIASGSVTASIAPNKGFEVNTNITASGNISASGYISASEFVGLVTTAQTASFVTLAQTASYVTTAQTASYVTTAQTASYVENAQTASFITGSNVYGPHGSNSVISSSHAITASHALNVANSPTLQMVTSAGNVTTSSMTTGAITVNTGSGGIKIRNESNTKLQLQVHAPYYYPTLKIASTTFQGYQTSGNLMTITNTGYRIKFGSNIGRMEFISSGNHILQASTNIFLKSGGATRLFVSQSGNIGINKSSSLNADLDILGNQIITGSLEVTGGITGSLLGTASYVESSSYAITASHALNVATPTLQIVTDAGASTTTAITGSNISASGFISASEFIGLVTTAKTASYVENAQTASYVTLAQTASFVTTAQTASYVLNAQTASFVTLAQTASFVTTAQTASFVTTAQTASYILADNIDQPFTDITASGNISASGVVYALGGQFGMAGIGMGGLSVDGMAVMSHISSSGDIIANSLDIKGASGNITSSGNISASGDIIGNSITSSTAQIGNLTIQTGFPGGNTMFGTTNNVGFTFNNDLVSQPEGKNLGTSTRKWNNLFQGANVSDYLVDSANGIRFDFVPSVVSYYLWDGSPTRDDSISENAPPIYSINPGQEEPTSYRGYFGIIQPSGSNDNLSTNTDNKFGLFVVGQGGRTILGRKDYNRTNDSVPVDKMFTIYDGQTSTRELFSIETGSGATKISGSATITGNVDIISSGSDILNVQGSQGQLFNVDDDLLHNLFLVTDISGESLFKISGSGLVEVIDGSITTPQGTINSLTASHAMNIQPENNFTPIVEHSTNFTSTSSYAGHYNIVGGDLSITVTTGSENLSSGTEWQFFQSSSIGSFTFTPGTGVTVISRNNNKRLSQLGSTGILKYISGQTFHLVGDLTI